MMGLQEGPGRIITGPFPREAPGPCDERSGHLGPKGWTIRLQGSGCGRSTPPSGSTGALCGLDAKRASCVRPEDKRYRKRSWAAAKQAELQFRGSQVGTPGTEVGCAQST